ncbi:MAG: hypothetical protein IJS15_02190 [Victivallales bacterium]|nr:hypothetical protein [Victivallales bacterium]
MSKFTSNRVSSGTKGSAATIGIAILIVFVAALTFIYQWGFCRLYVPAGHMAIVTAKTGKTPTGNSILVEKGEKGIWRDVLPEGRYFLNPVTHDIKIKPAVVIPLGKVGIVTSKVGKELPSGEIMAPDHDSKGVWHDVLGPGLYRLNPEGYSIELADAINIPAGYVGVITSQTGKLPAPGEFAKIGEKGVLKDVLQPGLYYINRYAYQVNVIEIGMNQVSMTSSDKGASVFNAKTRLNVSNAAIQELETNTLNFQQELRKQNVAQNSQSSANSVSQTFKRVMSEPRAEAKAKKSRAPRKQMAMDDMAMGGMGDGMQYDYYVGAEASIASKPASALSEEAQIFGVSKTVEFPSRDGFKVSLEMTVEFELLPEWISKIYLVYGDLPQVVEKIIMPQVLSVSRLKGSSYGAQDFIMGEGRENFQRDLRDELVKTLKTKNIIVHNAIIRSVEIPMEILQPLRAVSLAKEQDLTNKAMQETAKKLGELNTETELIEQRRREVSQETEKIVATTAAQCRQEVDTIAAEANLKVAEIGVKRSELIAKTESLKGETEVKARFLTENEKAIGEVMLAKVLGGQGALGALKAAEALGDKIETRVIYAGDGTLWTDLKNAAVPLPKPAPAPAK